MRRILAVSAAITAAACCGASADGWAGGFTLPQGQGQIIAGVGYIAASRTFDRAGRPVAAPSTGKAEALADIEYGVTDWLTGILAPAAARMREGALSDAYTGSDESAVGARLRLFHTATQAISVQALIEPPLGARRDMASEAAFGGPNVVAGDLRLQYAQTFAAWGWPAFATFEPGVRLRGAGFPDEARLDLTVGIRPTPRLLLLAQSFSSAAGRAGSLIASMDYSKVQASLVYDVTPTIAIQLGLLRTIAGRNAAREFGPFGAVWTRF